MQRLLLCFVFLFSIIGNAQSLAELIHMATENYPKIQSQQAKVLSAQSEVSYQKSDLVPQLSASYQANIGTANNITGLFLPGMVLPISGPPSIENSQDLATGSAAALLLQWNPFTFGKRSANIKKAQNAAQLAQAEEDLAVFYHQINFVNAYLDFWYADAVYKLQQKEVERAEFNLKVADKMVEDGIRPAVDAAQFKSTLANAKIIALQAKHETTKKLAEVQELLGEDKLINEVDQRLYIIGNTVEFSTPKNHPLQAFSEQQTALAEAEKKTLQKNLLPELKLWGTTFARGSSIDFDSQFNSYSEGLDFSRFNYGVGFELSIPVLEFARNKHLVKAQAYEIEASKAYEKEVDLQLKKEEKVAKVALENAIETVDLIPSYVEAAAFSFNALQSRYQSGLVNFTEVLQSQVQVLEAEKKEIASKVEFWKAMLYYAAIQGDISLFTTLVE